MGLFADLDKKLTENLYDHGTQMLDKGVELPEPVEAKIEELLLFVQPEARDLVRAQVRALMHEHKARLPEKQKEPDER